MSTKMEQLLDLLVNEEMDKAQELFHEIVVEKSRTIYENLIAEEAEDDEEEDESMEEGHEDDEEEDESVEEQTTFEIGGEPEDEFGGDASDDLVHGVSDHEFGNDGMGDDDGDDAELGAMGGEGDDSERIDDLEDALEELKAEFEKLMAGEEHEEEKEPGIHGDEEGEDDPFGGADDEDDEEDDEEDESMEDEDAMEDRMLTREYVERVGNDWDNKSSMKQQGKNVAANGGGGYPAPVEGKSPVSSGKGKPTSGATAHNILQGGVGEGAMDGTTPNAKQIPNSLAGSVKGEFTKTDWKKNSTPGANAGKTAFKTKVAAKGLAGNTRDNGSEGAGVGAHQSGDKAGQTGSVNTKSIVDRKQP